MATMRRTQSVRTYNKQPSASIAADDLGVLRESSEEPVEDVLRKQLLDKDRENDKLQTTILSLQAQLAQRPSIEKFQEYEKERRNLELLLQGTQRENERCMAEIDRIKTREKLLEQALAKVAGENWQSVLDITPSSASSARMGMGTYLHRAQLPSTMESSGQSASPTPMSVEATRAQFEQVRLLILGMEQRMQEREEKLNKTIERAETQEMKCEALAQGTLPSKLSV
ncbi:hypothetical protein F5J12DRAFT_549696 [Pisolithus orientalis]|uniref:uncharacterized protein n=1 Tax=Pisolithus orientalis TaxID=936130 RepID=UPI002225AE42|nr:uncharacterized protein F5J12DRAFT_549696 [Pisolithus orientalis]KAI6012747.1 hypothetical protein F5J12DRAFT_549696 [Pisolithus orientalis]